MRTTVGRFAAAAWGVLGPRRLTDGEIRGNVLVEHADGLDWEADDGVGILAGHAVGAGRAVVLVASSESTVDGVALAAADAGRACDVVVLDARRSSSPCRDDAGVLAFRHLLGKPEDYLLGPFDSFAGGSMAFAEASRAGVVAMTLMATPHVCEHGPDDDPVTVPGLLDATSYEAVMEAAWGVRPSRAAAAARDYAADLRRFGDETDARAEHDRRVEPVRRALRALDVRAFKPPPGGPGAVGPFADHAFDWDDFGRGEPIVLVRVDRVRGDAHDAMVVGRVLGGLVRATAPGRGTPPFVGFAGAGAVQDGYLQTPVRIEYVVASRASAAFPYRTRVTVAGRRATVVGRFSRRTVPFGGRAATWDPTAEDEAPVPTVPWVASCGHAPCRFDLPPHTGWPLDPPGDVDDVGLARYGFAAARGYELAARERKERATSFNPYAPDDAPHEDPDETTPDDPMEPERRVSL